MIIEGELRAWIADRRRQRAAATAAGDFAQAWNCGPIHCQLTDRFAACSAWSAASVVAAARDLFCDDGWVHALLGALTQELRRDCYFEPPFRFLHSEIHSGLLVYEDDKISIVVGVSRTAQLAAKKHKPVGPRSIGFTGEVGVLKFVKAGGATLSFWEAPPIARNFSATNAGTCRMTGRRRIEDGEILTIDGRHQSYVIEHAHENLLLLQANVKAERAPLRVEYDSATHAFVGCSAAEDGDSRIQMIATLLRKLGSDEAIPVLAEFLDHPSFFVRWHVLREMLAIDASAALPHLRQMAEDDSHPEVRQAAGSVVARIEARAAARDAA